MAEAVARRHVVLVGLPGSGKTTVGRLAAERLGAPFSDLDEAIAARAGKSVARIFAEDGEPAFRALEAEAGDRILAGEPVVPSPGGGFIEDTQRRRHILERALVIYLSTSPAVAAERLRGETARPLLALGDAVTRISELLDRRRAGYQQAHATVTTDEQTPDDVAAAVAELARTKGGW